MTRLAGVCALFFAVACTTGDDGAGPGIQPTPDLQCTTQLITTGTYTIGMAQPADVTGCWGVGTWNFTAKIDTTAGASDCQTAPKLLPSYSFTVGWNPNASDGSGGEYTYSYSDPTVHNIVKISGDAGGGGLCTGELNLFSTDGKEVWILKPELNGDNATLSGSGEYQLYTKDQWVGG